MNAINIFNKKSLVRCDVCDTPTDGRYRIGDKYYCFSDFQKESIKEKQTNAKHLEKINQWKRFVNIT